jgi:Holliday junction resolvase RusA-like endonuclease
MASERQPIRLVLSGPLPPGANQRGRMHRMALYRSDRAWAERVAWELKALGLPGLPYARVWLRITLVSQRGVWRDPDNAVASCKGAIDGVVRAGVVASDDPAHVELEVWQQRGKQPAVIVEIMDLSASPGPAG